MSQSAAANICPALGAEGLLERTIQTRDEAFPPELVEQLRRMLGPVGLACITRVRPVVGCTCGHHQTYVPKLIPILPAREERTPGSCLGLENINQLAAAIAGMEIELTEFGLEIAKGNGLTLETFSTLIDHYTSEILRVKKAGAAK